MKTIVSSWIEVGSGSPSEIIQAMIDSGLPAKALIKEVYYEYILDVTGPVTQIAEIRFEWEEDR